MVGLALASPDLKLRSQASTFQIDNLLQFYVETFGERRAPELRIGRSETP